jgi:hypothetical protein
VSVAAVMTGSGAFHAGLVVTAFGFGFRHGIDWDHIAALTDITSAQQRPRRSMFFATMYAVGHALVVACLGVAAIVLAARLPPSVDATMERVVGATLIALGLYVFVALLRHGRDFRMRSRWMLVFSGVRNGRQWARRRLGHHHDRDHSIVDLRADLRDDEGHGELVVARAGRSMLHGAVAPTTGSHTHRGAGNRSDGAFLDYAPRTAFGIGMIHGIGAETPTQLLIFLSAAGAGGKIAGLILLGGFLVGLLCSNTAVALAGTFGFLGAARHFKVYVGISLVTAVFSFVVGAVFLAGGAPWMPGLFGG